MTCVNGKQQWKDCSSDVDISSGKAGVNITLTYDGVLYELGHVPLQYEDRGYVTIYFCVIKDPIQGPLAMDRQGLGLP
jgi:hypothetical protein